jgi:hypothetical protein
MTIITTAGRYAAGALGYDLEVQRGLTDAFMFGGSLAESQSNLVAGGIDGAFNGAPDVAENYVRLTGGASSMDTGRAETSDFTWMIAARSTALLTGTNIPVLMGNLGAGGMSRGSIFYIPSTGSGAYPSGQTRLIIDMNVNGTITAVNRDLVLPDIGAWSFLVARVAQGVGRGTFNRTLGTGADQANTTNARVPAGNGPIRIGAYSSAFAGPVDVAAVQMHSVWLSDAEIDAAYAGWQARLTPRIGSI